MPGQGAIPKNYFLNESHELPVDEKGGGGKTPQFVGVNWSDRSTKLSDSLSNIENRTEASADPLRRRHYFIVANPVSEIVKVSTAKDAKDGRKTEQVHFDGEQSKVFGRLGLDLIEVHANGSATVHAAPEKMQQLRSKSAELPTLSLRDQARWVAIDDFEWIPSEFKFDKAWLDSTDTNPVEVYIQLQPLISSSEADLVIRGVTTILSKYNRSQIRGVGRSYLHRYFLRSMLERRAVRQLANEFSSIQSLHPPIVAFTNDFPPEIGNYVDINVPQRPQRTAGLPCVGVVDTVVPDAHPILQQYRRGNAIRGSNCSNIENDSHGSDVASRVVFGEMNFDASRDLPRAGCTFLEIRVGRGPRGEILVESVANAMQTAITSAPDVRVFNLSFDSNSRLDDMLPTQRRNTVRQIEELDNLAFDQDVLLVIAAGNAAYGLIPNPGYPDHIDNTGWELHSVPRAFNALTIGGIVRNLTAGGLASDASAPSPFTRIGPGFSRSPKPDLCATAGNSGPDYRPHTGSGVWAIDTLGTGHEVFGTSFAAPIVARTAAMLFEKLREVCPEDTRPFACTTKAILALTAHDLGRTCSEPLRALVKRSLGYGTPDFNGFRDPVQEKARIFWQGVIQNDDDIVRVQLPIPRMWIAGAELPCLRICVAWDTPVSAAVETQWSCRDVMVRLRPEVDGKPLQGSRNRVPGYPLFSRSWDLTKVAVPKNDFWTVELEYTEVAATAAGHNVSLSQRVALAAEIWDASEEPLEPHSFVQSLAVAPTLVRFSRTAVWLSQGIAVTTG